MLDGSAAIGRGRGAKTLEGIFNSIATLEIQTPLVPCKGRKISQTSLDSESDGDSLGKDPMVGNYQHSRDV